MIHKWSSMMEYNNSIAVQQLMMGDGVGRRRWGARKKRWPHSPIAIPSVLSAFH